MQYSNVARYNGENADAFTVADDSIHVRAASQTYEVCSARYHSGLVMPVFITARSESIE